MDEDHYLLTKMPSFWLEEKYGTNKLLQQKCDTASDTYVGFYANGLLITFMKPIRFHSKKPMKQSMCKQKHILCIESH